MEEGRITFVQASELLAAPTAMRRAPLDRVLNAERRVTFDELRTWVQTTRDLARRGPQDVADARADEPKSEPVHSPALSSYSPYACALHAVRDLPLPTTSDEITALGDLVACLQQRWEQVRPRRSRGRPRR